MGYSHGQAVSLFELCFLAHGSVVDFDIHKTKTAGERVLSVNLLCAAAGGLMQRDVDVTRNKNS
jgi:hypothetical protein